MFSMESKDRHEVKVRAQIRWKIVKPLDWVQRKGIGRSWFDLHEDNVHKALALTFLRLLKNPFKPWYESPFRVALTKTAEGKLGMVSE